LETLTTSCATIQRRYFTTVPARLDSVIETSPADAQASIAAVFAEVASVHPDLWRVLRDHAGHSALAEGSARLRRSVLAGTGVEPAALMPDLIWDDPNISIISVFSRQDPSPRLRHGDPAEQSLTQK